MTLKSLIPSKLLTKSMMDPTHTMAAVHSVLLTMPSSPADHKPSSVLLQMLLATSPDVYNLYAPDNWQVFNFCELALVL